MPPQFNKPPVSPPEERFVDPATGAVLSPEEWRQQQGMDDKNNP